MEQSLIMNRLPLPKYYDGQLWNTVIKPTRKSIPKYLHEDLPDLKHIYIKEKFQQIGKFNCPKLQYFDKHIKSIKKTRDNSTKKKRNNKSSIGYAQLKDQLQYALIIADKDSNVIDQLVSKAKHCQLKQPLKLSKSSRSSEVKSDTGKYFGNTVQLVFSNRKKQYLASLKKVQGQQFSPEIEQQINKIKLLNYNN